MSFPQQAKEPKNKMRKALFIIIGVVVIAVTLLFLVLNHFFSSDALKARAIAMVAQSTGRELEIDGDISLSLFPQIALKAGPARIRNTPGFSENEFASVKSIHALLDLKKLLSKNIHITSLRIDGLALYLQKDKDNSVNWNFRRQNNSATPALQPAQTAPSGARPKTQNRIPDILTTASLDNVAITDARVLFQDMTSSTTVEAKELNLEIHDFSLGRQAEITLRTDILVPEKNVRIPVSLKSQATLFSNSALDITGLEGHIGDTAFTGSVQGIPSGSYEIDASLALDDLKLNTYLSLIEKESAPGLSGNKQPALSESLKIQQPVPAEQLPDNSGKEKPVFEGTDPDKALFNDNAGLQKFSAHYKIRLDLAVRSLTVEPVRLENIKARVEAYKGVVRIKPFDCLAFKGTLGGEATVDLNSTPIASTINATLLGADMRECMRLFSEQGITGTLNATAHVSASGQTQEEIARTLSGSVSASAQNGVIQGLKLLPQAKLDGRYRRCSLSGSGKMGRFSTSDIFLEANGVNASGQGWVDIPKQTLDLKIQVDIPKLALVPVRIAGNFAALNVTMDTATTVTSTILNIGTQIYERQKQKEAEKSRQNESGRTFVKPSEAGKQVLDSILRRVLK